MNPWAALLGPVAPPALRDLPRQVHILADEVDHSKLAALPTPATPPPPAPAPTVRKRASRAKPVIANVMPGAAEFAYESEGVCTVHLPAGSFLAEVFFPKVRHGATSVKQAQPVVAPPIPRLAKPAAGPGPNAYRVPVFLTPKPTAAPALSHADAIRIRERARMHQSVAPYLLEEANKVVEETRRLALSALESST